MRRFLTIVCPFLVRIGNNTLTPNPGSAIASMSYTQLLKMVVLSCVLLWFCACQLTVRVEKG